jgi:pyruvate/2-oxoglutarate dehydrogenase complex dihydrolipoamide dehydrogenase (E3) component
VIATSTPVETYPGADQDIAWRRLVAPPDYRNPVARKRYHLAVIGAGPAGLVTAIVAAGLGADVALVEKKALGGDCLNVGCVPSKALLERARLTGDFDATFEWLRTVRARLAPHDSVERYSAAGVHVFLGAAELVDERTVRVGDAQFSARRIVIATGASPILPAIPGLAESRPLTNETVFDLRQRPQTLAILGAGPIGCELAQGFARLGVDVQLLEQAARVLPEEAEAASAAVAAALRRDGVQLRCNVRVNRVERGSNGAALFFGTDRVVTGELLVATGRRASTANLNTAAAHVELDATGRIIVDKYLRTTNRRIFAAGDVCSTFQFTHNADAHARICVQNALFAATATTSGLHIPRCTYTDPEVAAIGRTRAQLLAAAHAFDLHRVELGALDRGAIQDDRIGFVEVRTERGRDVILGATLVARDASELIAPLAFAMSRRLGLGSFSQVVLPYPTRSEYLKRLADGYNRARLTPFAQRLIKLWLGWRR